MSIQSRIIASWLAIFGIIGFAIGALSAQVAVFGMIMGTGIGMILGAFVGISIVFEHWYAVRALTNEMSREALEVVHTRTLYIALPYVSAFKLAEETLRFMTNSRLYRTDIERGDLGAAIEVQAGRESWITHVRMKISVLDQSRTQIVVDCRPKSEWLPIPDFGRNLELVQRITRFLESVSDVYTDAHQA